MARTYIAVPVDPARATEALADSRDAYRESDAAKRGYTGPPRIIRLRDKPTPPPLVSRMVAAAQYEGHTYSHMVQRCGAWLFASNGRHVVGVECDDASPSHANAKIAALLRAQVPDFAPVYTARVRDLLSHTPLVNVAGVVVLAESLRACLAVLPEGVKRVGVKRVSGDVYHPGIRERVRGVARLALGAVGWRATISPMAVAEECPAVALRKCKKGKV